MTRITTIYCGIAMVAAGILLTACATDGEADIRDQMVGMSDKDLATCLGPAAETTSAEPFQTKKYITRQITGDTCTITASLKDGKLATLDYASSGSSEMDSGCSWLLQRCLPFVPATLR